MDIKTLGIDLAKNIFQLHGVDSTGRSILRKRVPRAKLAETIINLPPCLIGLEACGSAHYWARKFQAMGHTVKLMAPQFVNCLILNQTKMMRMMRKEFARRYLGLTCDLLQSNKLSSKILKLFIVFVAN